MPAPRTAEDNNEEETSGSVGTTPDVAPWRDPDFVRLWIAQASGLIGVQFSILAVPLVAIYTLHASASTVALIGVFFNLPWVIFGLFIGVVVDRFSRRKTLIIADIVRALLLAAIPVTAWLGSLTIGQLLALGVVVGAFDVCWMTAYRSYVPAVVAPAHLDQAYAAVGASDAVSRTAVPTIAGVVIQIVSAPAGLVVKTVTDNSDVDWYAHHCSQQFFGSRSGSYHL